MPDTVPLAGAVLIGIGAAVVGFLSGLRNAISDFRMAAGEGSWLAALASAVGAMFAAILGNRTFIIRKRKGPWAETMMNSGDQAGGVPARSLRLRV